MLISYERCALEPHVHRHEHGPEHVHRHDQNFRKFQNFRWAEIRTLKRQNSEKYENYGQNVLNLLENNEIRALVDSRNETVGKKIREAEMAKIPFMLIVGENDEADNTISVRKHGGEDLGAISIATFTDLVNTEINSTLKTF